GLNPAHSPSWDHRSRLQRDRARAGYVESARVLIIRKEATADHISFSPTCEAPINPGLQVGNCRVVSGVSKKRCGITIKLRIARILLERVRIELDDIEDFSRAVAHHDRGLLRPELPLGVWNVEQIDDSNCAFDMHDAAPELCSTPAVSCFFNRGLRG